jgi:hypothetical protein
MNLRMLNRTARMEFANPEGDICTLLFERKRAQKACRLFLEELKRRDGLTRSEFRKFASNLGQGEIEKGFQYSERQFYAQVRRTLLTLGLVAIEQRFQPVKRLELAPERRLHKEVVDKYVAVRQPISRRPPDGLNLPRVIWMICKKWNMEFLGEN